MRNSHPATSGVPAALLAQPQLNSHRLRVLCFSGRATGRPRPPLRRAPRQHSQVPLTLNGTSPARDVQAHQRGPSGDPGVQVRRHSVCCSHTKPASGHEQGVTSGTGPGAAPRRSAAVTNSPAIKAPRTCARGTHHARSCPAMAREWTSTSACPRHGSTSSGPEEPNTTQPSPPRQQDGIRPWCAAAAAT